MKLQIIREFKQDYSLISIIIPISCKMRKDQRMIKHKRFFKWSKNVHFAAKKEEDQLGVLKTSTYQPQGTELLIYVKTHGQAIVSGLRWLALISAMFVEIWHQVLLQEYLLQFQVHNLLQHGGVLPVVSIIIPEICLMKKFLQLVLQRDQCYELLI